MVRALFLALVAAGFAGVASADSFKRISTEAEYRALVAGKDTCNEAGCAKAHKSGKLTGTFNGQKLRGAWKWHKGFWCRNGKIGGQNLSTDCQIIEVSGNKMRLRRDQGRGDTVFYTIK